MLVITSMSVYSVFKAVWNLLIGFIISIYLLSSKELFAAQAKKIVYAICSVEGANRFISNVRFAHKTFGGFFVGKILDSIIIGIICFVITSILGMPFCVLISVIIGVIPVSGDKFLAESRVSIKDFTKANKIANIGTPTIIPKIPQIPPKKVMEKITQKLDKPVELPSILGPIIFPSTC